MKKTLATALALFALAGTAVAQEAYGHWGYDNTSTPLVKAQSAVSAYAQDRTNSVYAQDRAVAKDPVTTAATSASQNSGADHRFRWDDFN